MSSESNSEADMSRMHGAIPKRWMLQNKGKKTAQIRMAAARSVLFAKLGRVLGNIRSFQI